MEGMVLVVLMSFVIGGIVGGVIALHLAHKS